MVQSTTLPGGDDGNPVMYEELAEVEKKFEDVDIWLMRQNYHRTKSIYAKRAQLIQRIPNFWAIVIEEAPEEIDSRIQPCDTAALSALKSIEVTRFEISQSAPEAGDPRSVKIILTFGENAWFTDRTLEKTFWHRTAGDGWTGLVSEPVQIHWKEGKDLTEGILDDAIEIFKFENGIKDIQGSIAGSQEGLSTLNQQSKLHQQLVQKLSGKIEEMPQDALSFFTWFGYRGRNVSAEESAKAVLKGNQKRDRWNNGENTVPGDGDDMIDDDDDDDDDETEKKNLDYEIYPAGEDLAIGISEDLFPSAIKYFIQSLNEDQPNSDDEAELDSGSNSNSQDSPDSDEPAAKKQKTTG